MVLVLVLTKNIGDMVWPIICEAIQKFFTKEKVLNGIDCTFLAPIPKISDPDLTTHNKPISLRNTLCKIIQKVLVNTLKPYLENIISPF